MTTMLELTKHKLDAVEALTPKLHPVIEQVTRAITNYTVHPRMKAVIAVSHIMLFASQFRRNIEMWDGTEVPINSIGVVLCDSGAGKDSSHRAAKRCFEPGYELITKHLEVEARKRAIQRARNAEEDLPDEYEVYKKYLDLVPPFETAVTTGPGLIALLNTMEPHDLGANYIYSGEFGDQLTYNANIAENITILAELYDLGVREGTFTKGVEFRSKAINGQSLSALMMGSPVMLYDEAVKYRFETAFMSKLARRSFFCYVPEPMPSPDFMSHDDPMQALDDFERALDDEAAHARAVMRDGVVAITTHHLKHLGTTITTSEEVRTYYTTYKRYNSDLVEHSMNRESTSALIRRHLQWKALKVAGAFAILDCSPTVELDHFIAAIQFCELLSGDMQIFENDLNKSYYERFSDYCHTLVRNEPKVTVDVHDIKKRGFLANVSRTKLQEMINLCASYDKQGIYSVVGDGAAIQYEPIIKSDAITVSYKPIDTRSLNAAVEAGDTVAIDRAKQQIAMNTAYGYELGTTTFSDLGDLLSGDFAYSNFRFRDGTRGRDNIIGSTKWIILDIDDSVLTASEAHFLLMDINHYISLSSDPNNEYKFRILIELDAPVELAPVAWKHFIAAIAEDLALKADPLPQSQIFFSYAGRPVLSQLDAEPLSVRDYIMTANERSAAKEPAVLTTAAKKAKLNDPLSTFIYAFEAPMGQGSRSLIRAAMHARDLGATRDEVLELMENINNYWEFPMPRDRFEKTILAQVMRMF